MVTYVLVHGGGHGGWCWQRVARPLRAAGHEVHTPTLTGLGERCHLLRAGIDLETHIKDIAAVLYYEDLRDVILVGHSYGGTVITGVADRMLPRIGQLVYLDAPVPQSGESIYDTHPRGFEGARRLGRVVDGIELVLWPEPEVLGHYGLVRPEDIAWARERLTPHPWACFEQKLRLSNEAAIRAIPRMDIYCKDSTVRRPNPKERASGTDRVWEIDTGHDLMITEPAAVTAMLLSLAKT